MWYGLDDVVELTDISLNEFFELPEILPLVRAITMSSSMLMVGHRFECIELIEVVGKCIFTKSLTGTAMQDGGTRERSIWHKYVFVGICSKMEK